MMRACHGERATSPPADNQSFLFGGEDLQSAICTPRSRARVGIRSTCLSIIGVIDMGEPR